MIETKKWIVTPLVISLLLGGFLAAGAASAEGKSKKVDEITCEEFLAMDPSNQNAIAYWIDGYYQSKNEAAVGTVAYDKFGQPIGALVDDCKATPKATLWSKMKKHL